MKNTLVRLLGWKATVLHGDPTVLDRWHFVRQHLKPGSLRTLDAGCGSGAFTMWAAKIGNQAVGLSFDESNNVVALARAKSLGLNNVEFITGDVRDLDELAPVLGEFDQVICLETIEHVLEDDKVVAGLSRMLVPGGRLLLGTPYKQYRRLIGDRLSDTENGGHVRWGYTHEELRHLFEANDLEVTNENFISGVVPQQLTNLMRILGRIHGLTAWAVTFPLRVLQVFDEPLTNLLRYPYMTVGVVGVKRFDGASE